jgi:hypothetical protein
MLIPRDRLEHAHAVALCVEERHILPYAGYFYRLAEHSAASICNFPH